MTRRLPLVALLSTAALALSACGLGGEGAASPGTTPPASTPTTASESGSTPGSAPAPSTASGTAGAPAARSSTATASSTSTTAAGTSATAGAAAASSSNRWAAPGGGRTDCSVHACVALTFDDGPDPGSTDEVLDALAARGVPATFFVIGENVARHPDLVAREAAEGHEIGSHTYTHVDLTSVPWTRVGAELDRTQAAVEAVTGHAPTLLRPPWGAWDADVATAATARGLSRVLWNVDTLDWRTLDPAATLAAVDGVGRGDVVLLHDIYGTTSGVVGEVVDRLEAHGYTLVTVSDLRDG